MSYGSTIILEGHESMIDGVRLDLKLQGGCSLIDSKIKSVGGINAGEIKLDAALLDAKLSNMEFGNRSRLEIVDSKLQ